MDSSQLGTAKQIFEAYCGSSFFMQREGNGDYEKYIAFHVSPETERTWLLEMQTGWRATLEKEQSSRRIAEIFPNYARVSLKIGDENALYFMVKLLRERKSSMDSYTLALCISTIIDSRDILGRNKESRNR